MEPRNYLSFLPDKTPGSAKPLQIVVDTGSGLIAMVDNPADVSTRLDAEKRSGAVVADELRGGALFPALTDAHHHVILYATFEMAGAVSLLGCKDKKTVVQRLKNAAARRKDPALSIFAITLDTSVVTDLTRHDIDEAVGDAQALAFDISMHSAIASTAMLRRVADVAAAYHRPMLGSMNDNGVITEEYTMRALEIVEEPFPPERIADALARKLQSSFQKGITTIHDMMPATTNEFIGALLLRKRWRAERGYGFPLTMFYLNRFQVEDVLLRMKDLEAEGLLKSSDWADFVGLKLFADGAFGAHTAKVSTPYCDTATSGILSSDPARMEEDIRYGMDNGLRHVAIHCIGDEGCRLALTAARIGADLSTKLGYSNNIRIEHFQLPLPVDQCIRETLDTGANLCMQTNFLLDYNYADRLGGRVREMCPHRAIFDSGVPVFLGTDGMPDSMLFSLYLATHAIDPSQRLGMEEALHASSAATADFEGDNRGRLREGDSADLVLADASLLDDLTLTGEPEPNVNFMKMMELEDKVKRTYRNGVQVHPKPKG